jgi:hypothetical protein
VLNQGCKEGGLWFLSPLLLVLLLPDLPCMDKHFHLDGLLGLTVSQVFCPKSLGAHHCEASYIILCINCYTMWKEINMNYSFWIPKLTCHDLASWQLCWVTEISCDTIRCWSTLALEWSGTPMSCHRSLFPLIMCLPWIQTSADVWQTQQHAVSSGLMLTSLGPIRHTLSWSLSVHA